MGSLYPQRLCGGLLAGVLLWGAGAAVADISPIVFRVEASNESGSGVFEVSSDELVYIPELDIYTWVQTTPVYIHDGSELIAILNSANLALKADPQIAMGFAVQAGASDTTFVIQSALLSFATIPAAVAEGRASAGFTATDLDGDGAALLGLGEPGTGAYRAEYNGFVPGGTKFADLVYSVIAGPGGSGSGSQDYPPFGYADIADEVYDMSAQAAFTLTAYDMGSGTSSYEIVPEPATLGLLALAGVVLLRYRR